MGALLKYYLLVIEISFSFCKYRTRPYSSSDLGFQGPVGQWVPFYPSKERQ